MLNRARAQQKKPALAWGECNPSQPSTQVSQLTDRSASVQPTGLETPTLCLDCEEKSEIMTDVEKAMRGVWEVLETMSLSGNGSGSSASASTSAGVNAVGVGEEKEIPGEDQVVVQSGLLEAQVQPLLSGMAVQVEIKPLASASASNGKASTSRGKAAAVSDNQEETDGWSITAVCNGGEIPRVEADNQETDGWSITAVCNGGEIPRVETDLREKPLRRINAQVDLRRRS